jgi:hypothetical protein
MIMIDSDFAILEFLRNYQALYSNKSIILTQGNFLQYLIVEKLAQRHQYFYSAL